MEREGLGAFEAAILVLAGVVGGVVGVVWGGAMLAWLAVGRLVVPSVGDAAKAVRRLPGVPGDPGSAWAGDVGRALPGPVVYWACTAVSAVVVVAAVVGVARWLGRNWVGSVARRPLGVDSRARLARRWELGALLVRRGSVGRFVVARRGRWLVATESAAHRSRWGTWLAGRGRAGDRGGVALVGPQRSGKTVAAIAGVLEWEGPAVLSSVRSDLVGPTVGWRSRVGEVRAFDPTGTLGATPVPSVAWSPVRGASTVVGAQRAARALCDAAPRGAVEGGLDFWLAQAEILLNGLLYVAHHTGRHMGTVCGWVLGQDRPSDLGPGDVRTFLDYLLASEDDDVALGAAEVSKGLVAIWEMEERTQSSVYATAQTVVWPWSEPDLVVSSTGESVELDWVLEGGQHAVPVRAAGGPEAVGAGVRRVVERPDRASVPARGGDGAAVGPAVVDRDRRGREHAVAGVAGVRVDVGRVGDRAGHDLAVPRPDRGGARAGVGGHDPDEPPDEGVLPGDLGPGHAALRRAGAGRHRGRDPVADGGGAARGRVDAAGDDERAAGARPCAAPDAAG